MIKRINIIVIALLIVSCKQEKPLAEGAMRLSGSVKGMKQGILLLKDNSSTDTIRVFNGKFEIEKPLQSAIQRFYITPLEQNSEKRITIYLEPNKHQLELDIESFEIIKVTGSKTQDEVSILEKVEKAIEAKHKTQLDAFKANIEKIRGAYKNKLGEKVIDSLKDIDNDFRQVHLAPYFKEQKQASINFIKENPKSYISYERLLYVINELSYKEASFIYNSFPNDFKTLDSSKRILTEIENKKKGVAGALAGNFNATDINGKNIKLEDFKGKYLLIDFWASWCVPCRKGNPHLLKLYKKYHPKGLEILGVSDDDRNTKAWRRAVKKDGIGVWHHILRGIKIKNGRPDFSDKSTDVSDGYNIHSLPTKILVDPNGIIIGRYGDEIGGTDIDMDKKLAEIFNNK